MSVGRHNRLSRDRLLGDRPQASWWSHELGSMKLTAMMDLSHQCRSVSWISSRSLNGAVMTVMYYEVSLQAHLDRTWEQPVRTESWRGSTLGLYWPMGVVVVRHLKRERLGAQRSFIRDKRNLFPQIFQSGYGKIILNIKACLVPYFHTLFSQNDRQNSDFPLSHAAWNNEIADSKAAEPNTPHCHW